jgi:hypothetical protein
MLIGFVSPYPSMNTNDSNVMGMVTNVMNGGWPGTVTNVTPTSTGPYTSDQHLFSMVGSAANSPGGHTIFCTGAPNCGWNPVCDYVMNVK